MTPTERILTWLEENEFPVTLNDITPPTDALQRDQNINRTSLVGEKCVIQLDIVHMYETTICVLNVLQNIYNSRSPFPVFEQIVICIDDGKMLIKESSKTVSIGQDVPRASVAGFYSSFHSDPTVAKWHQCTFLSRESLIKQFHTQLRFKPRPRLHPHGHFSDSFDVTFDGKSAKIILSESELRERSIKDSLVAEILTTCDIREHADDIEEPITEQDVTDKLQESEPIEENNNEGTGGSIKHNILNSGGSDESFDEIRESDCKEENTSQISIGNDTFDCANDDKQFSFAIDEDELIDDTFVTFSNGLLTCRIMTPGLQMEIDAQRERDIDIELDNQDIDIEGNELEFLTIVDGRIVFKPEPRYNELDHDESYCLESLFTETDYTR